jgi:hypothetical protein
VKDLLIKYINDFDDRNTKHIGNILNEYEYYVFILLNINAGTLQYHIT